MEINAFKHRRLHSMYVRQGPLLQLKQNGHYMIGWIKLSTYPWEIAVYIQTTYTASGQSSAVSHTA